MFNFFSNIKNKLVILIKNSIDQFKRDRDIYMAAMRDREIKMREINLIFKNSVDKANFDARSALTTATGLKKLQNGYVRTYALNMVVGVVALVATIWVITL